jgi:hypothetical protein
LSLPREKKLFKKNQTFAIGPVVVVRTQTYATELKNGVLSKWGKNADGDFCHQGQNIEIVPSI